MATPPTPPKPARYHHAPAPLAPGRTVVRVELLDAQLQQLLDFLTDTLKGQRYT